MPLDPEVPILAVDPAPGSAGEALNAYAELVVARWAAAAEAGTDGPGIFERTIELVTYDDLVASLEAEADRLTGLGLDITVDPLP